MRRERAGCDRGNEDERVLQAGLTINDSQSSLTAFCVFSEPSGEVEANLPLFRLCRSPSRLDSTRSEHDSEMASTAQKRVRGVTVSRPIVYGNSCVLLTEEERAGTDHTHRWTVGVRSAASAPYPNQHPNQQIGGADDIRSVLFHSRCVVPN